MVESLDFLDNLSNTVSISKLSHNGGSVNFVVISDLIRNILQFLFVSTDQNNVESILGQSEGILSTYSLLKSRVKIKANPFVKKLAMKLFIYS